jgi:hypothetical protein
MNSVRIIIVGFGLLVLVLIVEAYFQHKEHSCFMKPDGSVYCYENGVVKRLRADKFEAIY